MFAVKPVILVSNKVILFFFVCVDKTLAEMLCYLCPNSSESISTALICKDNSISVYVKMINIKHFVAPGEAACNPSVIG